MPMKKIFLKLATDEKGQDLIEYALMTGFVVVAAGAIMPGVSANIKYVFDKVACIGSNAPCTVTPPVAIAGDPTTRIICAALAALFLFVIVFRRRPEEE